MLKNIARTGKNITLTPGLGVWNKRCGGRGNCGSCRITLVQGVFKVDGRIVNASAFPAQANACQTILLSDTGIIDIPPQALLHDEGTIAQEWHTKPLPEATGETIAVDLGTTTVVAVRLNGRNVTGRAATFNRQAQYGDNVIQRISYGTTQASREHLQQAAAQSINHCLSILKPQAPERVVIAANTVMTSLLWKIDTASIGIAPFLPKIRHFSPVTADTLGLELPPKTPILALPAISGFVGGDITAGLGELNLQPGELLLDLGTNCEMAYHDGTRILCATAAAGPAFEGATITAGTQAIPGAIDHLKADLSFTTLGNLPPTGLCGSAMVDFLACARALNLLTPFGTLNPQVCSDKQCMRQGIRAFAITPDIIITEQDIEQLLKAKAAIAAGLQALLGQANRNVTDLRRIYLAGGFANYLDLSRAQAIGMLPQVPITIVGNTALAGAARLALQPQTLSQLDALADQPQDLPLANMAHFADLYADALTLP